jgi:hypothetical protein
VRRRFSAAIRRSSRYSLLRRQNVAGEREGVRVDVVGVADDELAESTARSSAFEIVGVRLPAWVGASTCGVA